MRKVHTLFEVLTNFDVHEFYGFASLVCSTIRNNARSTGNEKVISSKPWSWHPSNVCSILSRILKHDNINKYQFFEWNVTHSPLCGNVIFIASCITNTLAHEIFWLDEVKQWHLSCSNLHFSSCIKIIDGTIIKIQKPWNNPNHTRWFNGQKNLYCMKNMVMVS